MHPWIIAAKEMLSGKCWTIPCFDEDFIPVVRAKAKP